MLNERKYIIFNVSEIEKINFDLILESSPETLRTSQDGQKTFVKWSQQEPDFICLLDTRQGPYTHEEIINILSTEEWQKPLPNKN